jgi:DMSO reductase family type II enzyme heme b subunit
MTAVTAKRVPGTAKSLLSPSAPGWKSAPEVSLDLKPTPLEAQPSAYIQAAWKGRRRAKVGPVAMKAIAVDGQLLVRLQWAAATPHQKINDNDVYADACALLFPSNGEDAEISTMGSPDKPVTAWYWRAGAEAPFLATAQGLGTVTREKQNGLQATGEWSSGQWQVVLAGPAPARKVGVAVWSGAADDRAGLKSHTPSWVDLQIG